MLLSYRLHDCAVSVVSEKELLTEDSANLLFVEREQLVLGVLGRLLLVDVGGSAYHEAVEVGLVLIQHRPVLFARSYAVSLSDLVLHDVKHHDLVVLHLLLLLVD